MAMTCAEYTQHFTNMGNHVDFWNSVEGWRATVLSIEAEHAGDLVSDKYETEALADALKTTQGVLSKIDTTQSSIESDLTAYMKGGLAEDLDFTGTTKSATNILIDLVEDMVEASQTVRECTVAAGTVTYDAQNTGTFCMSAPSVTQLVKNENFEFEITTASVGADTWQVTGSERTKKLDNATTASEYTCQHEDTDETLFTCTIQNYTAGTGYYIAGATDTEMSAFSFTGAVKGVTGASSPNTDAQGDVYVDLDRTTAGESGDNNNQIVDASWDCVTGIVLLKNTDVDAKLHLSIVDEGGGDWRLDLFKDSGRASADKVAHTATYVCTGVIALVADNSSGLGGNLNIGAITAADVDIYYTYACDRVKVYKESGKSNLVAAGGLVGGGSTTLYAQNSSGLTGSVTVAYSDGEADWQVRVGFAGAVGDKIYAPTTTDDNGLFLKFFRDQYGVALNEATCGSETIAETLAQ